MDRRQFLTAAGTAGGIVLLGGGFYARQAYARGRLSQELVDKAKPLLSGKARKELDALPNLAREDIRRYFDGVCLNVNAFAAEVCSPEFIDKLRQRRRKEEQHELVVQAFTRHTGMTDVQVMERVGAVAEAVGKQLDDNWLACCRELADDWNIVIDNYHSSVTADELSQHMAPVLERGLSEALRDAQRAGLKPILGGSIAEVGKSSLLLMSVSQEPGYSGLPAFAASGLRDAFESFLARVRDRSGEVQQAVTDRIAAAGNRMSLEFQKEVRARIQGLHRWQEQAVAEAAGREAEKLIRIL
jgi:hypothetical protein